MVLKRRRKMDGKGAQYEENRQKKQVDEEASVTVFDSKLRNIRARSQMRFSIK